MFEYNLFQVFSIIARKTLFGLRASLLLNHQMIFLLILLMKTVLLSFLLKLSSHHLCTFTSPLQQALM